jgi:hypothetical protein
VDAMKSGCHTVWAGVEFQPDLQILRKPVRLGVILVTSSGNRVLLGRQPRLDSRPQEFLDVGTLSLELAATWVDSMWKDILEAGGEDPFAVLSERWRWNIYLVRPARVSKAAEFADLLAQAKQTYQRFVGEPFSLRAPRQRARREGAARRHRVAVDDTSALTQPWLISEIMKRTSELSFAAGT